jgi:hypothetical protein
VLCVGFLAVDVGVPRDEGLQRDAWRSVARELGPPSRTRLIALTPGWQVKPLSFYSPWVAPLPPGQRVTEVDTIGYDGYLPGNPGGSRAAAPGPPFRERRRVTVQRMTIVRYVAPRPALVTAAQLTGQGGDNGTLVFVQPGTTPVRAR